MTEENKEKKEVDQKPEALPTDANKTDKPSVEAKPAEEKKVVEEIGDIPSNFKIAIGKKIGMTQLFDGDGNMNCATLIKTASCKVVYIREKKTDGYTAICLGFEEIPEKKLDNAAKGVFKKHKVSPVRHLKEFRVDSTEGVKPGQMVRLTDMFKEGEYINVQGVSKGKGFAGAMKRHNFAGTGASHGASNRERAPGSISSRRSLGRVIPGQRMAGHMGHETVTMEKVQVLKIDSNENSLYLKSGVPGPRGTIVYLVETTKPQPKPKVKPKAKGKK